MCTTFHSLDKKERHCIHGDWLKATWLVWSPCPTPHMPCRGIGRLPISTRNGKVPKVKMKKFITRKIFGIFNRSKIARRMCVPSFSALAQGEVWKKSVQLFWLDPHPHYPHGDTRSRVRNGHFREVIKTKLFGISTRGFQHRVHCVEILP